MSVTNLNPDSREDFRSQVTDPTTIDFGPEFGVDDPLWGVFPVSNSALGLSKDLCTRLETWEAEWEHHVDQDYQWDEGFDHEAFNAQGDNLAAQVAVELGQDYRVQRTTGDRYPLWRSDSPPTRPRAAANLAYWIRTHYAEEAARREDEAPAVAANVRLLFPPPSP